MMTFEEWKKEKSSVDFDPDDSMTMLIESELKRCWSAALDEAAKVVETEELECGERYALAEAIKELKE